MAEKIKTRDRILSTALALFNAEGESRVSTVDIAAALGISPGNLYYHFRGKEEIIEALFDDFETELRQVLSANLSQTHSIEDHWVFLYIIFEEIVDFRFFYDGPSAILDRCPSLSSRTARLVAFKRSAMIALLAALEKSGALIFGSGEKQDAAEQLAALLVAWLPYCRMIRPGADARLLIHEGVRHAMMIAAPYAAAGRSKWRAAVDAYFNAQVKGLSTKRNG